MSYSLDRAVAAFATAEYKRLVHARAYDLACQRAAEVPEADREAYQAATQAERARTDAEIARIEARRQARTTPA